jgi:hypothetical protein
MRVVRSSTIDGEFTGWDGETVFVLTNGQKWQQAVYRYCYKYRPTSFVYNHNGMHFLKMGELDEMIQVRRIT